MQSLRGRQPRLTTFTRSTLGSPDVPLRLQAILWLTATVLVVGPVRVGGPQVGLDPGWAAGLNLAHEAEMRFGRELIFSYGPWGFLDAPLVLTRSGFLLGLGFSVASVVAVWLLTLAVLRSSMRPRVALVSVSLLTITLASVSSPSFLLTAAAVLACICHLRNLPSLSGAWCPVAVAGLAALLFQVKLSEGIVVTALALATSLTSPRARLVRTAGAVLAWVVTSSVLWLAAGQSSSDFGPWIRASTDVVTGYASAMSLEGFSPVLSFLCDAIALLLFVSVLILGRRRGAERSVVSHAGCLVVTVAALFFGFKAAFTRQDPEHNAAFFVIAALLLCALLEKGPRWRATVLLITVASLMASPAISALVRVDPAQSWVLTWRIVTSDASRSTTLNQARAEGQIEYGLPSAMVEATQGSSVAVDPWEVSMVWAYSMRWRPMPGFQSYAAYTAGLDQLNAEAARVATGDQMIIRATTVSTQDRLTTIDQRNPMWESPRYTLAVVCSYSFVTADKRWMLLRKNANKCADPSPTSAARQVSAGERVPVPRTGADWIVTASFVPTSPNPLVSLAQLIFKDPEPLMASVDGDSYRLPEGLASGPLLTVLPRRLPWPAEFRGHTSARSLSFSRPGKVQFHSIHLIGQR